MFRPKLQDMQNIPAWLDAAFILITLITCVFYFWAARRSARALVAPGIWMAVTGILALNGFFLVTTGMPPRFVLTIGIPLLTIILLFLTTRGKRLIDDLDPSMLTLLHVVRIPVELTLYRLFVHGAIPELMTFEGRNLDILSGISAPLIWYFGYRRAMLPRSILIAWNFICLGLLANIVGHAILAAPFAFQTLAFDQPNIGVLYFPYIWLPAIVVPLVLFSHLVSLRRLFVGQVARTPAVERP